MMERSYGRDGMDPGIPNKATCHSSSLWHPFYVLERQQHLSFFMKNYQTPLENIFIY